MFPIKFAQQNILHEIFFFNFLVVIYYSSTICYNFSVVNYSTVFIRFQHIFYADKENTEALFMQNWPITLRKYLLFLLFFGKHKKFFYEWKTLSEKVFTDQRFTGDWRSTQTERSEMLMQLSKHDTKKQTKRKNPKNEFERRNLREKKVLKQFLSC